MASNYNELIQDPNVRKYLDLIAATEGVKHGYNTGFGNTRFESLADHPRVAKSFKQTDGKTNTTTAAGRYQFLSRTWDEAKKATGAKDFGPEGQDMAAVYLIERAGALDDVVAGRFDSAISKTGGVWASLPSSPYAQPKRSAAFVADALGQEPEVPNQGNSPVAPEEQVIQDDADETEELLNAPANSDPQVSNGMLYRPIAPDMAERISKTQDEQLGGAQAAIDAAPDSNDTEAVRANTDRINAIDPMSTLPQIYREDPAAVSNNHSYIAGARQNMETLERDISNLIARNRAAKPVPNYIDSIREGYRANIVAPGMNPIISPIDEAAERKTDSQIYQSRIAADNSGLGGWKAALGAGAYIAQKGMFDTIGSYVNKNGESWIANAMTSVEDNVFIPQLFLLRKAANQYQQAVRREKEFGDMAQVFVPVYKNDPKFNGVEFAMSQKGFNGANYSVEDFEYIARSQSREEFNNRLSDVNNKNWEEKAQANSSMLQNIAGGLFGSLATPTEFGAMFVGGAVMKLPGLAAVGGRAAILTESAIDAATFGAIKSGTPGQVYTMEDVALDTAIGFGMSIGIKAATGQVSKAISDASQSMTADAHKAAADLKEQTAAIQAQVQSEMGPNANPQDVANEVSRRLDEVLNGKVTNTNASENALVLNEETMSDREKVRHNEANRLINENDLNISLNEENKAKRAAAAQLTEAANAGKTNETPASKPLTKADESGISDDIDIATNEDGTVRVAQKDPSTPPAVIEAKRSLVEKANQIYVDIKGKWDTFNLPTNLAGALANKKSHIRGAYHIQFDSDALKVASMAGYKKQKVSKVFKGNDRKGQTAKVDTKSQDFETYRNLAEGHGLSEDLMQGLNEEFDARYKLYIKDPKNLAKVEAARKGKSFNGKDQPLRQENIFPKKDVDAYIQSYSRSQAGSIETTLVDGSNVRVYLDPVITSSAEPKVVDVPAKDLPANKVEEAKPSEPVIPDDKEVLTDQQLFDKLGINPAFRGQEPRQAIRHQMLHERSIAEINAKNAQIDPKVKARQENALKRLGLGRFVAIAVEIENSTSATLKNLGRKLLEQPLGTNQTQTAAMHKKMLEQQLLMDGKVHSAHNDSLERYALHTGYNSVSAKWNKVFDVKLTDRFSKDHALYRLLTKDQKAAHPMHSVFRDYDNSLTVAFNQHRAVAIKYKLPGYQLLEKVNSENYMPKRVAPVKWGTLSGAQKTAFAKSMIDSVIATSNLPGKAPISPKHAAEMVRIWVNNADIRTVSGHDVNMGNAGQGGFASMIEDIVNDKSFTIEGKTISDSARQELAQRLKYGIEVFDKTDIDRDLNATVEVPGNPSQNFKLIDVMDYDTLRAFESHSSSLSGQASIKHMTGIGSRAELDDILQTAKLEMAAEAQTPKQQKLNNNALLAMEQGWAELTNTMIGDKPRADMSVVRSWTRAYMLSKSGFPQMIESMGIALDIGIRDAVKSIAMAPVKSLYAKSIGKGEKFSEAGFVNRMFNKGTNDILGEVNAMGLMAGADVYKPLWLRPAGMTEMPVTLNASDHAAMSSALQKMLLLGRSAEEIVSRLSFMKMFLSSQQTVAHEGVIRKMHKLYAKAKSGDLKAQAKLEQDGFSMSDLDAMSGAFITNKKGKLVEFRPSASANGSSAITVVQQTRRITSQIIQETFIGERGRWIQSETMRNAMFMRSYTINAIAKQSGRLYIKDGFMSAALRTLAIATFGAAPVLYARQKLIAMAMNDEDREKFEKKNLSFNSASEYFKFGLAAVAYAAPMSMLSDVLNGLSALVAPNVSPWRLTNAGAFGQIVPLAGGVEQWASAFGELGRFGSAEDSDLNTKRMLKVLPVHNTTFVTAIRASLNQFIDFGK